VLGNLSTSAEHTIKASFDRLYCCAAATKTSLALSTRKRFVGFVYLRVILGNSLGNPFWPPALRAPKIVSVKHRPIVHPLALVPVRRSELGKYLSSRFLPEAVVNLRKEQAGRVRAAVLHAVRRSTAMTDTAVNELSHCLGAHMFHPTACEFAGPPSMNSAHCAINSRRFAIIAPR
jgi:hypothetical protein